MIVFLEAQGTNAYNRYPMCPAVLSLSDWKLFFILKIEIFSAIL